MPGGFDSESAVAGTRCGSLDVVVPMYNEAAGCGSFHAELSHVLAGLPCPWRVIYVDDGSTDGTAAVLGEIARGDRGVVVLELSRNFGHQAALTAGLDFADADAVVMLDGDGQHPPKFVAEMVRLFEGGYDIVQMQRTDPPGSVSPLKRATSAGFYSVLSRLGEIEIGAGLADFRLISREVLEALRGMQEYHRFIRGMVPWVGFRRVIVAFEAPARASGKTKYTLRKMVRLASHGLFSFSLFPLRIGVFLGVALMLLACLEVGYVLSFFLSGRARELVPGWSSLMIMLTLSSGVTMVLLGFIGIYVGMIFQQVKGRPVYIVRRGAAGVGRATHQS